MRTLSQDDPTSKLLTMTDNVVTRNRAYRKTRNLDEVSERREYGRLDRSIRELAETAEKYRKGGAQP